MNSEINTQINVLPPFKYFCSTIGELPTSYLESMTYYETVVWLCNYLKETIIPTVNNTGNAVTELQDLYVELENYVNTYFDNLDVQEEINKKLDDMANDGSLTNLIKNYVTPFINAQNTEIAIIRNDVNRIDNKVDASVSGSPLSASSVNEMTDTSRIYVNTTNGYWYYYDGTAWTQGEIYQSRGLADGSVTKFNLNNELRNDIYYTLGTENLYNTSQEDYGLVPSYDAGTQLYGTFASSQTLLGFILPVISGNTITVEKTKGKRFRIATSSVLPAQGVSYIREWHDDNSTKQIITLNENENYIFVDYYSTTVDTLSQNEIKNSIKIYYGNWVNSKTQVQKLHEDLSNEGISTSYLEDESVTIEKTNFVNIITEGTQNLYNTSQEDYGLVPSYDPGTELTGTFATSQSLLGFILPVTTGNTITVEKTKGKKFRIATSSILPARGVSYIREWHNDNSTKQIITLNENENYIFVDYYSTTVDTLPQNEIKNSIKVYYGDWVDTTYNIKNLKNNFSNLSPELLKIQSYRPFGSLDKGYLCLIADDGNMTLSTNTFDILKDYEVPATFALMSTSAIMNEETGDIDGLKNMINNYGCSVCQHGLTPFDEYTEDELIDFLDTEKAFWISKNITVKGLCYPNHINNQLIRAICGSKYDICCGGWGSSYITSNYQLNTTRTNIFALSRTSIVSYEHLNDAVDYAVDHNKLMIVFWHDNSLVSNPDNQTKLENFLTYAKSSGIEFITLDKIMNL